MTLVAAVTPWQPDALDRALSAMEWTAPRAERVVLERGERTLGANVPAGFVYVASGELTLRESGDAVALSAGDLVFFPGDHAQSIAATARTELVAVAVTPASDAARDLDVVPSMLIVHDFDEHEPNMPALIDGMPCHVDGDGPRPGSLVVCSRIATMIISAAVRVWAEHGCAPARWLRAGDDPHIRRALDALHAEVARAWSVEDLARVATMSRSAFAARFRAVVGQSPASYLTTARMDLARELLPRPELSVADIARRLGYGSDAGFSRAFRRDAGMPPALWRTRHLTPAAAPFPLAE